MSSSPKQMGRPIRFLRGRWIPLSLPRRFVGDMLALSQGIPTVPMQRRMRLGDLREARAAREARISWCAIFMKAYALVAKDIPELRRSYIAFPWAHLYEHPANVASFSLERNYNGEPGVFVGKIANPDKLPLTQLDGIIRHHKTAPLESIPSFRHGLRLSGLPQLLRRTIWRLGLSLDGSARAYFFGTFGVSVVASFGAASLHVLSPLTTTLNYGVFEPDGSIDVRVVYDHRVFDGATMARAMAELERVLHEQILPELLARAEHSADVCLADHAIVDATSLTDSRANV